MTAVDVRASERHKARCALACDPYLQALRSRSPSEIERYINTQVRTLAEARAVLVCLAKAVAYMAQQEFGDQP